MVSITIIFIIITIAVIYGITRDVNKKIDSYMSFKESMDLTELPVVTFYQGDTKINFLLDTGSNDSIINENALKELNIKHKNLNIKTATTGVNGEDVEGYKVEVEFNYKGYFFLYNFQIMDVSKAFDSIKKETGVNVHGILGNQFFKKYSYILDFDKLVAYSKK
ncbi:MAG: aspartyl protease family protein [Clostridium sp.]